MHGFVAFVNDLHKGRDSGPAWSLVLDASASSCSSPSSAGGSTGCCGRRDVPHAVSVRGRFDANDADHPTRSSTP
ncbi:PepSY-associated TM helix domain-containing protein [Paludisphaera mucosa]|uniref:PepSY-associated TM helix domain-containing protein n=1 Tax=Paludisphaera mucosa TaxID=3030827 RepID=UPI0034A2346E